MDEKSVIKVIGDYWFSFTPVKIKKGVEGINSEFLFSRHKAFCHFINHHIISILNIYQVLNLDKQFQLLSFSSHCHIKGVYVNVKTI